MATYEFIKCLTDGCPGQLKYRPTASSGGNARSLMAKPREVKNIKVKCGDCGELYVVVIPK